MGTNRSRIELASGPKRQELSLPPSQFVLVVGAESETDQAILDLANEGFLTLRFDPSHTHWAWDPRAGSMLPTPEEVEEFATVGQQQPGAVKRDGDKYYVNFGRNRLKRWALYNRLRSEEAGTSIEPGLFRCIVADKGATEEMLFEQQIAENFDRKSELPTHVAHKLVRAKNTFRWSAEKCQRKFGVGVGMQGLYVALLDCSEAVRALVDRREVPVRVAALLLTKVERERQIPILEQVWAHNIRSGEALWLAVKRLVEGDSLFGEESDCESVPPTSNDIDNVTNMKSGAPPDTSSESRDTSERPSKKAASSSKDSASARLRAPSRSMSEKWIEMLKPHTHDVELPKGVSKEVRQAFEAVKRASFLNGGRVMAMRYLGKAPAGWGTFRDVLEGKE